MNSATVPSGQAQGGQPAPISSDQPLAAAACIGAADVVQPAGGETSRVTPPVADSAGTGSPKKKGKRSEKVSASYQASRAAGAAKAVEAAEATIAAAVKAAKSNGSTKAARPPATAEQAEAEQSTPGDEMVNTVVGRSVLAQPTELQAVAAPQPAGKKARKKPLSSWAEIFVQAMRTLEGSAPDAAQQACATPFDTVPRYPRPVVATCQLSHHARAYAHCRDACCSPHCGRHRGN